MIRARLAIAVVLIASLPFAAPGQARETVPRGFGFLVIGPDTQTMRSWTAHWIREVVERDAPQHLERMFAHDSVILALLDTEDAPPSNPPPGPSAVTQRIESYPHDLRIPVILPDLQRLTNALRVQSFAQVIIEPLSRGFRLTAQVVNASDPSVPVHLTVTALSLRAASARMAYELIAEWEGVSPAAHLIGNISPSVAGVWYGPEIRTR